MGLEFHATEKLALEHHASSIRLAMTNRTVFSPTHSALDNIFAQSTTYIIPAYQRPYSWRALGKSDKTNQVNQMWDDLWTFFEQSKDDKEYFLGSMVVIERKRRTYEVIDGQQRLTTLALLFAAIQCFLHGIGHVLEEGLERWRDDSIRGVEDLLFNKMGTSRMAKEFKVKIERSAGYDFDTVLNAAIQCKDGFKADDRKTQEIVDRYFENRNYFRDRMREKFMTDGRVTSQNASRLDAFYEFLMTRVAIVLITTADFETAYFIFETLNNRGLPLTARDLLRNFMIKELAAANDPDPAGRWAELEGESPLDEDFIGRWVESTKASQIRYSVFNDMVSLYQDKFKDIPGKPKAFGFHEALLNDLERYGLIKQSDQIRDLVIRHKIDFIQQAGNLRYGVNLLLALFRKTDYQGEADTRIVEILTAYQRWTLYTLLAPGVLFRNTNVYRAIASIQDGKFDDARNAFELSEAQRQQLRSLLQSDIVDNDTAKLLVSMYVWQEEVRSGDDVVAQRLKYQDATLEHIMPRKPAAGSNWTKDFTEEFRAEYTNKLGNMTLLTGPKNARANNRTFEERKLVYKQTQLAMTRELATLDTITPQFIKGRHVRIVDGILAELGL